MWSTRNERYQDSAKVHASVVYKRSLQSTFPITIEVLLQYFPGHVGQYKLLQAD